MRRSFVGICLVLMIAGCGMGGQNAVKGPGPELDEPTVDRMPYVSGDPKEIADVRAQAERELDQEFAQSIGTLRKDAELFLVQIEALEARKPRAIAELERIAADVSLSPRCRMRAAALLAKLGRHDEGTKLILEALQSRDAKPRHAAVTVLGDTLLSAFNLSGLHEPRLAQAVVALVDDPHPEIAADAAALAARNQLAEAEPKLLALLRSGKVKDTTRLAQNLAALASTPESVQAVCKFLFRDRPKEYDQWVGFSLNHLLAAGEPRLSEPVKKAFREYLLAYTGDARLDQAYAIDLARVANDATKPVLEDILTRSKDVVSRFAAVSALVALDREGGLQRLIDFAHAEGPEAVAAELAKYATERDAERILPLYLEPSGKKALGPIDEVAAALLYDKLGAPGRDALARLKDRLTPRAATWLKWKREGLNLAAALDDLHAAAILPEGSAETIIRLRNAQDEARARGLGEPGSKLDLTDPEGISSALALAGRLVAFDAETGELPCRHDRLLMLDLGAGTNHAFPIECAVQSQEKPSDSEADADEGPYRVRFIVGGRLFRFGAENRGDWYDLEAAIRAANFALETAGRKERFIPLETEGQVARFAFADPNAFLPIALKYGLALSDDPDRAIKEGKGFERQVIERMKNASGR